MGILEEIARGGRTSALDVAKAEGQGQRDYQELQMQSLKMEDWLEKRDQKRRLDASLKGTDFTTSGGAAEASGIASDIGSPEMAITLAKLSDSLKAKDKTAYGNMKPLYVDGKLLGYGQRDSSGKYHNIKTIANIEGKKKDKKASKVGTPSGEQITTSVDWVKRDKTLGEEGVGNVGFSSDDYERLGRAIASRSKKLQADAKDLGQGISDQEAMRIATDEVKDLGLSAYTESSWGEKELVGDVEFEAGTSSKLMGFLGISTNAAPTQRSEGDTWSDDRFDYRFINGKTQSSPKQ